MTLEIAFLFGVLAAMMVLFVTEKMPVDLTAFLGLSLLALTGLITPEQAFTGFSSPAVITMLGIFIVSGALGQSGVADAVGRRLQAVFGSHEMPLMVAIMLLTSVLSAFMNNVAAAAVVLPAVSTLARHAHIAPARLFMPLAFGAILGGTLTLVGTPPNLLAAEAMSQRGLKPFDLFDFTPFGLALVVSGTLFMATIGRKLLPSPQPGATGDRRADLTRIYRIQERLFSIKIPANSPLVGRSLRDAKLGMTLGVTVVQILRGGRKLLAPGTDEVLRAGDVLLVAGRFADLRELLRVQGVVVDENTTVNIAEAASRFSGVRLRISKGSELAGRTLRQLSFRERFGVVVAAIWRDGQIVRERLANQVLREGDEILALGSHTHIELLQGRSDLEIVDTGTAAIESLMQNVTLVRVPENSPLAGAQVGSSRLWELMGLTVVAIVRDGKTLLTLSPDREIRGGDQLLVAGAPARILSLLQVGNLEIAEEAPPTLLESEEIGVVEAVVAPRSVLAGKTIGQLEFRSRYGMQVLAVWREGEPIRSGLADVEVRFGDALLLQGPKDKIRLLSKEPGFVVLAPEAVAPFRRRKAPIAVGGLLLMVALVVLQLYPVEIASFVAATLVLGFRAITTEEAYRAIEWRAIFLVAAILPIGLALERTGAAVLMAETVIAAAGPFGPHAVLVAMIVLSSLLSQALDGSLTVILLSPIVIQAAAAMGVHPEPLLMGVALSASATFMTPFSGKATLLIMAAGGYKVTDFMRVGTPLTILFLTIVALLVPVLLPF